MQGAVPVYSSISALQEVMEDIGFSYLNADYNSFHSALNAALYSSQENIRIWQQQILCRHNWKKVVEHMKGYLL